jgi:transcriptional regulator with XRE-family HTH domain
MPRSVKLRSDAIGKVQTLVHNTFYCQKDLADELGFAQSTISNFISGKPVDRHKFQDICEKLGIEDWRTFAEVPPKIKPVETTVLTELLIPTPPAQSISTDKIERSLLENPEGSVPLNSNFYIERLPHEADCKVAIAKPHALIRLKAPRQMGKTSLMMRILRQAESQGNQVVYLNLDQVMEQAWSDADRFLHWFCASVSIKAKHNFQKEEYASLTELVGSTLATQEYFESYLLPDLGAPLTIGLDSIDLMFDYPHLYNNFFSLLRSLHEAGKQIEILSKLRLIISHAAEVYIPLDINHSPFNVGVNVEFSEFGLDRVQLLAAKHQLNWTQTEIDRLMALIGGHPFLIRLAMFEVASGNIDLASLLTTATSRAGIFYQRHLARLETTLNSQPDLLAAFKSVISSKDSVTLSPSLKGGLEALGLVKFQGEFVIPRSNLYRQYFSNLI